MTRPSSDSEALRLLACCIDCGRKYGDEYGFPDLVIPNYIWRRISPSGDDGGLLCPSCICKRLHAAKITNVEAAFMSGSIQSVTRATMQALRMAENLQERLDALLARADKDNAAGQDAIMGPVNPPVKGLAPAPSALDAWQAEHIDGIKVAPTEAPTPRMCAAVKEARGIGEGCKLEQELSAALSRERQLGLESQGAEAREQGQFHRAEAAIDRERLANMRADQTEEALRHILWVKDCGIDGRDESGEFVNFSAQERDEMYLIAKEAVSHAPRSATQRSVDIVFDGPPGHESGRFVEVESPPGKSIKFGEWLKRDDGYWVLRCVASTAKREGE